MSIANVTLNNTFDEWRSVTNQLITFVNDVENASFAQLYSNTAALTVTENIARGSKNFITLNVSSNVLDRSTLNVATANAVNIVFAALANTDARIVLISNDANTINAVANAAIIHSNSSFLQANAARDHANASFAKANSTTLEISDTRAHSNLGFAAANAGLIQANTARDHANVAFRQANTVYDLANVALGNVTVTIESNKAAFLTANLSYAQANTARDHANAAFYAANVASTTTDAFLQANTARDHANAAFSAANNAVTDYSPASNQANTARVHANVSFEQANTARIHANVSFEQANTARVHANVSFAQANTARVHANVSFEQANTARIHANVSFEQANTSRVHANAAFLQANTARDHSAASFEQANTARVHANAAFERANSGFSNTSGVAFAGNLQFPTGNITIGEGDTQGIRIYANGWIGVANIFPQIKAVNGTQFINLNANTNVGGWNDLVLDRDLSIIYSKGTFDDGANLVIGPWSDSSFGYKQDGTGRHGFNTSSPRFTLDANGSANISGPLLVWNTRSDQAMNVVPTITAAFAKANTIGTLGTQSSSSVSISGGTMSGVAITGGTVSTLSSPLAIASGGTGGTTQATARSGLGLGNMAEQSSSSVVISGGSISGITDLAVADGGTGASTAADARTNLGLGSMATQSSSSVSISGGSITGITDLTLADGGTNASLTASHGAVLYSTASALALSAVGTSGQVLMSKGASAPTWEDAAIPAGTTMLFVQTAAPLGWTKDTTSHNNKALRIVTGTASSGGTVAFTTAFASRTVSGTSGSTASSGTVASTTATGSVSTTTATGSISSESADGTVGARTLTVSQMPTHNHNFYQGGSGSGYISLQSGGTTLNSTLIQDKGGSTSHDHGFTPTAHSHTFTGTGHTHTFTGTSHSHTFTGDAHTHSFSTSLDMAVQYVDAIIATKDAY